MESEEKKLDTKLKQLAIAVHRTKQVLDSGKKESIKRHLQALRETVRETNETKRAVESAKIAKNDKIEEINVWNDEIETKLEQADADIFTLEKWISDKERSEDIAAQEERFNLELKLHEKKLKMQHELALSKTEPEIQECTGFKTAKLPKLVISKYDGSYMDWSRFWGQFTEAIDKSSIPPITKFTYLRELLSPKVRRSVEALPFSAEGYNRAKSILADRYGKESEIINSYVKEILELPYITNANTRKIAEFSEKLSYCVQALETMKRLDYVQGNVAMTLEKLAGIRGDLVRTDPDWESWDFGKLSEALRQWVKRNPVVTNDKDRDSKPLFNARGEDAKIKGCVYCGDTEHKATQCNKVTESSERKKILARKGLCFNCATRKHRASDCSSKVSCQHCSKRHHSSICEKRSDKPGEEQKLMTDGASDDGVFPVVVVKVNGVKCRALIDSGAGGSYASAKLIKMIDKQPNEIKTQRIDMLMASKTTRIEMYDTEVSSLDENFKLNVRVSKVDKPELLTVNNPRYDQIVQKYDHLQSVTMDDRDTKEKLPIHLVLGNGEYARVKTSTKPLVSGKDGEPVAEKTKLGWVIMSPGIDFDRNTMLMTQTTQYDFENLCRLDVLGLADVKENDQSSVYEDFKEQLVRNPTGYYEANLPWKSNHPPLPTNEAGSRRRLTTLVKKLKREGNYEQYNDIIREQLDQGIIEVAPEGPTTKEFYLPHKAVVKKSAETTKLRIVYDASAKEQNNQPSLNECINPGPPLQNLLWGILIRSRFHPVLLTSDIQKAFLQVRIKEQERDALRFFWQSPESDELTVYRFTRALFGLTCSPFLLGGVINEHLKIWEAKYPELVKEIRDNLYVDDLITGGENVESVAAKRMEAIEVFEDATFRLHKWHSNVPALENHDLSNPVEEDLSYADEQLGSDKADTKLLGLAWNKSEDTLTVVSSSRKNISTKREALSQLAKVYDPLGLVSPTTLIAKMLYREICEAKVPWDAELGESMKRRWEEWQVIIAENFTIPRTLAPVHQPISAVTLHAFGDASKSGVSAVVYAVVEQDKTMTQGLVCSKSRLAKQNLTIPRLELVAAHMAKNLVMNVERAIDTAKISSVHCWSDSTVTLYWINGQGEYRQFVSNRVAKIKEGIHIQWHHVSTDQNPADLGSRGGRCVENQLWQRGPDWLSDPDKWPPNLTLEPSEETRAEAKIIKNVFATTATTSDRDELDKLLEAHELVRVLRIGAWIRRFVNNCKRPVGQRETGPLRAAEIQDQYLWWCKRVQQETAVQDEVEKARIPLNLQPNDDGILECRGRIEGEYPVFLPRSHLFTQKLVHRAHESTLHGGVSMTMAKVRERFWVPSLRQLVKRVRSDCWGCKRFRAKSYENPPPAKLPTTRTQGSIPFEVLGVDFAGPIRYRTRGKTTKKAYLVLYGCSLTRAVHLEVLRSLELNEFLSSLKRFIARRGRPRLIYSDNGATFKAAEKWLKGVQRDEQLNFFLSERAIEWKFNLSRAPWWGGQYERLIGLFKRAFYKTIGNGILTLNELEDVVLDVEVALNNRPLSYLEDDVELPVLTPSSMLSINPNQLPESKSSLLEEKDLRKRAKFIKRCKLAMWKRWSREYVRSLRERHVNVAGKQASCPRKGSAVIVQDESKNRNVWKLGIVTDLIKGKDDVVRGAKVRTAKGELERAVQHLYPLELSCEVKKWEPNPDVASFVPRPKRDAAAAANLRMQQHAQEERREQ